MEDRIQFTIFSPPVSLNKAYITRRGSFQRILSPEGRQFRKTCFLEAQNALGGKDPFGVPIALSLKFYFCDARKRDLDNYNKLLLDSLKGVLYEDDSQIFVQLSQKIIEKETKIIVDAVTLSDWDQLWKKVLK